MKLFLGIRCVWFRICRFLPPAPMHCQNKDIALVDLFINYALDTGACGSQIVFPTKCLEFNIGTVPEANVQLLN